MSKKILKTILFYGLSFLVLYLISMVDKGGPCAPPLGMMLAFFIFAPLCIFLFARNTFQAARKGKYYLPSAIIHGLFIAALCVGLAID